MRELGVLAECLAAPPPFPADAAMGAGQPIIVLPGFCSPNFATARLREFLAHQNFAPTAWDLGVNLGPTKATFGRLENQIAKLAKRHDAKVSLVGLSLGGTIAREMAKRRPELVARIVTLASPIKFPVATPLAPLVHATALLWDGDAKLSFAHVAEPPPVPVTAIVSRKDGLVDWLACVPDASPNVETLYVDGAHVTMGSNPAAQRIVAARLAMH